jgi:cobyrinic acid a,c-diamide synthase
MNSMHSYARLIIAGLRGGSGKTTVSLATIVGLRMHGLNIAPFKKGPDYIDAGWLAYAAGNPCYTLDPFLMPADTIVRSFQQRYRADVAVIEGNRGLHDGKDAAGSCSTAEIAKLLQCPVILVVDGTKMTRTAAALVLGCMKLDEAVQIAGVILNRVSGQRHAAVIREAIETYCGIPVVGVIPTLSSGQMPERHMGLTPYQERDDASHALTAAEEIARQYLQMPKILEIARQGGPLQCDESMPFISSASAANAAESAKVRIGVLRDAAFQFYYPENLEELVRLGAEIVEIDALQAAELPPLNALYIGGGFPETNALQLAENISFRSSVKAAADNGLPIYAECGGLMFLGEVLVYDGQRYPMTGVFPLTFVMHAKPRAHGYSIATVDRSNPYYPEGTRLQGHEFHYSSVSEVRGKLHYAFAVQRGEGIAEGRDGICFNNVLATYIHTHALGTPLWAAGLIRKAREYHG